MTGQEEFLGAVSAIAGEIGDAALDNQLEARLNERFPAGGETFLRLSALCSQGEAEGWLLNREAGGIKFGRAVKPGKEAWPLQRRHRADEGCRRAASHPHHRGDRRHYASQRRASLRWQTGGVVCL